METDQKKTEAEEVVETTIEEQDTTGDAEFDAAFAEAEKEPPKKKAKPKAEAKPEVKTETETDEADKAKDKKSEEAETVTPKADKADEEEDDIEETAVERMNRLAGEADEAKEAEEQAKKAAEETAKKIDTTTEKETKKPVVIDDKFIDGIIEKIENAEHREAIPAMLAEFPELKSLLQGLAQTLATEGVVKAEAQEATGSVSNDVIMNELARTRLLMRCEAKNPGSIHAVESPDFVEWIEKQTPAIQAMADSGDIDKSVAIIQAFQEERAKKSAKKVDEDASGAAERRRSLHKSTVKPKNGAGKAGSGGTSLGDFWDEAVEKG